MNTSPIFIPWLRVSERFLKHTFFAAVIFSLSVTHTTLALTSDFTVRTLIGDDTIPPTVPAPITATPVAMSQIDLSWGTSTDDYLLSGYQVFRDDVQIATTTLSSYSDVGLFASTTYAYYVTAYDFFNNISASSSVVAATTFATPTPPTTPPVTATSSGPIYGSKARLPELVSLEVIPSQYGALIRFETEGYVRSVVRWGTSISYELGSSVERSFSRFHEISIIDLRPGTRYRFSIEGENHMGRFGTLTESTFTTLPPNDETPPGIVTGLTAVRDGNDIVLTWQNPRDPDYDHVRVVRSELFYPSDEADGWVVFDGDAREARDKGVAVPGARLFYSVFTYDEKGNISSAAVVAVRIPTQGGGTTPVPINVVDETKNEIELKIGDIDFYQDDEKLRIERGTITINGSRHLTIAVPYEALPEHLKTILVTLTPSTDQKKELQFILRINKERTAYTARLAPLGVAGDFMVRVSVFDFKTAQIGHTQGRITSTISIFTQSEDGMYKEEVSFISSLFTFLLRNYILLFISLFILLAFLARSVLRRRSEDDGVVRE